MLVTIPCVVILITSFYITKKPKKKRKKEKENQSVAALALCTYIAYHIMGSHKIHYHYGFTDFLGVMIFVEQALVKSTVKRLN
jgi:hypothetical protein